MENLRKRKTSRVAAILLSLMMVVVFVPTFAFAADAAKDVTVYVTVSNGGTLFTAKDGSAAASKKVTASDINADGAITYDEALVAAHKQFCADGAAGYVTSQGQWGLSVDKLWGVDTFGNLGIFKNNIATSTGVGDETVAEGDYLMAAIFSDWDSTDRNTLFDSPIVDTAVGKEVKVKLQDEGPYENGAGLTPTSGVAVGLFADGAFAPIGETVTDENGEATVAFDKAGTYVLTANGTVNRKASKYEQNPETGNWDLVYVDKDCQLMPPVCIVEVKSYEALDDDGDRAQQTDATDTKNGATNNIVYSGIGMFRLVDEGTSVIVNEDGSVTATVKTAYAKSNNYDRIALMAYPEENAEALLDKNAIIADNLGEDGDITDIGLNDKGETTYSAQFIFTIPAGDVGKKIPITLSSKGKWKTQSSPEKYFVIVLPEAYAFANTTATVADQKYTGKALEPKVALTDGETALVAGTDFTVAYEDNVNVGTAKAILTAAGGKYVGTKIIEFKIAKANQPMKVTFTATKSYKAKALKKAKKSFTAVKVTKNQGKVSYKVTFKGKAKKALSFSKGKVTVKKGAKKGTYKLTVKVTAKGNANYKSGSKSKTITVKVK